MACIEVNELAGREIHKTKFQPIYFLVKIMSLKADYGEIPTSPIKMFPLTAFQQKECQKGLLG